MTEPPVAVAVLPKFSLTELSDLLSRAYKKFGTHFRAQLLQALLSESYEVETLMKAGASVDELFEPPPGEFRFLIDLLRDLGYSIP